MKEYTSPGGERRIWYEPEEIEAIMLDELHRASLTPDATGEDVSVDLECLLEKHLKVELDQYAPLESSVLGVTTFRPARAPKVEINRSLTESAVDEEGADSGLYGRWRATLGHEASHVLLHRMLYEVDSMQRGLFAHDADQGPGTLMRCLHRDVGFARRSGDWREVQANKGMAALLMPRPVFVKVVRQEMVRLGLSGQGLAAGSAECAEITRCAAQRFRVSREATSIRLDTTGIVAPRGQQAL